GFVLLVLLLASFAFPPDDGDQVVGLWLTGEGKAKVKIYELDDHYYGKIIWSKQQEESSEILRDINNPEDTLRTKPIIGLEILRDFVYQDDEWVNGMIYDPESGNDYKAKIALPGTNALKVRGYILIPFFGRSEVWTRTFDK
ncbi:MAG TPA: DUF2147 domain-containing protein, partial [Bacteroidota bacterium]